MSLRPKLTANHTPAPWVYDPAGATVSMRGQAVIVAPAPDEASTAVQRANAALIASAPELLAALWQALESLEWAALIIQDIPSNSLYMEVIREGREAIAKATRGA